MNMMQRLTMAVVVVALSACRYVPTPAPVIPTAPPLPDPPTRAMAVVTVRPDGSPVPAVAVLIDPTTGVSLVPELSHPQDGYTLWTRLVIGRSYTAMATWDGAEAARESFVLSDESQDVRLTIASYAGPWDALTAAQLLDWRGYISTVLAPVTFGPRPGRSDNVLFSAEYTNPGYTASDRSLQRAAAKAYTHWPLNPLVSRGYHDRYPNADWRRDVNGYLDRVEELYRDGYVPVFFLLPDTGGDACADGETVDWACVETTYTPLFASERFQRMARIVVLAWEPNYRAADWQAGVRYMQRVFPKALKGIHMPSNHGAPCRGSELAEAGGPYANEAACFAPVLPLIDLVLQQETFTFTGDEVAPGRTGLQQFLYNLWDMGRRLPSHVSLIAFEWGSYTVTNAPEKLTESDAWGRAAIDPGAAFDDPLTGQRIEAFRFVRGVGDGGVRRR